MLKRGRNQRSPTFQADNFNHCTRAPATPQAEQYHMIFQLVHVEDTEDMSRVKYG